jgi:hypothetical protein
MIRRVSSTTVRPISATLDARDSRADAACSTPSSSLGLLEELRIRERDAGMRRQRGHEGDVAVRPGARLAGRCGQGADDPVVVDERRDQVARELEDALVAGDVERVAPRVGQRGDPSGPQHLPGPALADTEDRERAGDLVRDARPRGDDQPLVAEDPDRDEVGAQAVARLVDDHPEQRLAVV